MATTQTDRNNTAPFYNQNDRPSGLVSQAAYKGPVLTASTTNIVLSGEQTVGGVALVTGDRVGVFGQTDGTKNGLYVVNTGVWDRAADFRRTDDVVEGTTVKVNRGTNVGRWVVTTQGDITFDATAITFAIETTAPGPVDIGGEIDVAPASAITDADEIGFFETVAAALRKITWANLLATMWTAFGGLIAGGTVKAIPVDADKIAIADSQSSNATKMVGLTQLWGNYLKAKADALYQPIATLLTSIAGLSIVSGDLIVGSGVLAVSRLAKGSPLQVLRVNAGGTALEYADLSSSGLGIGQTWQTVTRVVDTSYQNTTGKPIVVSAHVQQKTTGTSGRLEVSTNNSTWVIAAESVRTGNPSQTHDARISAVVPDQHYYRYTATADISVSSATELR